MFLKRRFFYFDTADEIEGLREALREAFYDG